MIRSVHTTLCSFGAAAAIAIGAIACGGSDAARPPVKASLELPSREARIALRPALDVSGLYDASIADRIAIEEITINLGDARLLGADPRIPAGGLALLNDPRMVSAYGSDDAALELPFPEYLLAESDLAVYVRIDQSAALEGASVVVRGRVYAHPASGGSSGLTSDSPSDEGSSGSINPDGDPAKSDETDSAAKHDDERDGARMARGNPCQLDPDGDPAACAGRSKRGLVARGHEQRSIPFELRGHDVEDLVAGLGAGSSLDVVIGIPAEHWITPAAMAELDRALAGELEKPRDTTPQSAERNPFVLDQAQAGRQRMENGGYFISDDPSLSELKVRRGE